MKNSRYYPFERNRYFYGKLLTVRDFESEQKYFNDKRRMMNRLLFGAGVVTGLQVVAVDDKSVSVEMGAAIDALGREIVVPAPVTLKLSMVDGFTNNEYAKNVYLCIAYDEKGKEPVHSIANSSVRSEEVSEYNRVLESYRLFVREEAPDPSSLPLADLAEKTTVLYKDAQVRVLLIAPKYVNPGQTFRVTFRIEKTLQAGRIEFGCELAAKRLDSLDGGSIKFEEPRDSQGTEYEFHATLRAEGVGTARAAIGVKPDSAVLRIGDRQINQVSKEETEIYITTDWIEERLMDDFLKRSLETSLDSPSDPCVYLAKIALLQMGPTYVIERVEQVPFGEFVYNPTVSYRLALAEARRLRREHAAGLVLPAANDQVEAKPAAQAENDRAAAKAASPSAEERPPLKESGVDIRSGHVDIPISPFAKSVPFGRAVKSFFSPEIEHGLGAGHVMIVTSVEEKERDAISDMAGTGHRAYFGETDVFAGSEFEAPLPEHQLGVVAYPEKGTFRIGIKVRQMTEARTVRVRWWAYREEKPDADGEFSEAAGIATIAEAAAGAEPETES
jgi:hypothetical protein